MKVRTLRKNKAELFRLSNEVREHIEHKSKSLGIPKSKYIEWLVRKDTTDEEYYRAKAQEHTRLARAFAQLAQYESQANRLTRFEHSIDSRNNTTF